MSQLATASAPQHIDYFPPRDTTREPLGAPIDEVTLLEDRAQVRRRARPSLEAGHHRLVIEGVSPILQDVSLHAEVVQGSARVADVHVRRALRARRDHKDADVRAVEAEIRQLEQAHQALQEDLERVMDRAEKLNTILTLSAREIPQDVAWGISEEESWRASMEKVFSQHRALMDRFCVIKGEQSALRERHTNAVERRQQMDRPDQQSVAWLELDLIVELDTPLELTIEYVVPNAMWRPMHSARLDGDVLSFTSKAALWQNTGEDWIDVQTIFSTARSSLGTEPPLLYDDLLRAQRKSEETVVQMREVAINQASVKGGGGSGGGGEPEAPRGVELPGVEDGGEVRNLRAEHRVSIPSDGRPNFIDLFEFKALAEVERVLAPELTPRVILRSVQRNTSATPVLAGPVELLLQGGPIGWTSTLFVAPGERFELGFGVDDVLRATRAQHLLVDERDAATDWRQRTTLVQVFLSNLGDEARALTIKERVPISELEKVQVFIIRNKTTEGYEVDEDGIVTWKLTLEPHQHRTLTLQWRLSTAPDVTSI